MNEVTKDIGIGQAGQQAAEAIGLMVPHFAWLAQRPERSENELRKLASSGDRLAQFEYANLMLALAVDGECNGFEALTFASCYAEMAASDNDPRALFLLAFIRMARASVMLLADMKLEAVNDQAATLILLDRAASLGDAEAADFGMDTAKACLPESVLAAFQHQRFGGVH